MQVSSKIMVVIKIQQRPLITDINQFINNVDFI